MRELDSRGLFPLKSYVKVDPDEIRSHFPGESRTFLP